MKKTERVKLLKKALNIVDNSEQKGAVSEEEAKRIAHEIFMEVMMNIKIKGLDY